MLVLTRTLGEMVHILTPEGREIVLQIVDVRGRAGRQLVRLGFTADPAIRIHRHEHVEAGLVDRLAFPVTPLPQKEDQSGSC